MLREEKGRRAFVERAAALPLPLERRVRERLQCKYTADVTRPDRSHDAAQLAKPQQGNRATKMQHNARLPAPLCFSRALAASAVIGSTVSFRVAVASQPR